MSFKVGQTTSTKFTPYISKYGTNRVLSDSSNWYQKESTIDTSIYSKEPMLTVTLAPSDITKIREYNKDGLRNYNCTKFKENFSNIFSLLNGELNC